MNGTSEVIGIPALTSHVEILRSAIPRIQRLFKRSPVLVTPEPEALGSLKDLGVVILADDEFVKLSKKDVVAGLPDSKKALAGWYYQQILKYEIVLKSRAESVLIVDADTVLLSAAPAPAEHGWQCPCSHEHHSPYFATFETLTGLPRQLECSAIVNFMWFSAMHLTHLVEHIERHCQMGWRQAILKATASRADPLAYSEYETYANWHAHLGAGVTQTPWRLFRRGDLLLSGVRRVEAVAMSAEKRRYDAIAFEQHHRPTLLRKWVARSLFACRLCTNFRRHS